MGSAVDAAALEPTANGEPLPDPPPPPPFPGDPMAGDGPTGGASSPFEVLEHMTEAEKQAAGKVRWLHGLWGVLRMQKGRAGDPTSVN